MTATTKVRAEFLLSGDRIKVDGEWFTVSGLHGLGAATWRGDWIGVDVHERAYGMQFQRGEPVEYVPFQRVES